MTRGGRSQTVKPPLLGPILEKYVAPPISKGCMSRCGLSCASGGSPPFCSLSNVVVERSRGWVIVRGKME